MLTKDRVVDLRVNRSNNLLFNRRDKYSFSDLSPLTQRPTVWSVGTVVPFSTLRRVKTVSTCRESCGSDELYFTWKRDPAPRFLLWLTFNRRTFCNSLSRGDPFIGNRTRSWLDTRGSWTGTDECGQGCTYGYLPPSPPLICVSFRWSSVSRETFRKP